MNNYKTKELKNGEIISLGYDLLFKKVFADDNNIERLEGLIGAWLNVDYKEIKGRVKILNNQKSLENRKDKEQEYDIAGYINLESGGIILNIEINMTRGSVLLRNFTYAANMFSRQFDNKDDYKKASQLIQLSFDNFDINPKNPKVVKHCYMRDETNKVVEDNFEVIHIDIEKCKKIWYDKTIEKEEKEDRNLILLGALLTLTKIEDFKKCLEDINMEDNIKENITDAVEEFSLDKDIYVAYDREKEKERIHRTDVLIAEEKGAKQKSIEIAKNLLKNNVDIEIIINSTGLSKQEIEKLK